MARIWHTRAQTIAKLGDLCSICLTGKPSLKPFSNLTMKYMFKRMLSHFFVGLLLCCPLKTFTLEERSMTHFHSDSDLENYSLSRELGSTGIKIKPIGFGAGQLSIGEY